jgi:cytochrome P450
VSPRSLPFVGELLSFQADRLGFLTRLAANEGDIAKTRLGPYQVWVLTHPDHVRDVLMTNGARFRKSPVLQRARVVLGDGLLTSEGDTHRSHRQLIQPAFQSREIANYANTMITASARTCENWTAGQPLDVHTETVKLTLATAGATLLGSDVERDAGLVEHAIDNLLSAYKLAFVPFGWLVSRIPVGPIRRLMRGRAALYRLVDAIIDGPAPSGTVTASLTGSSLSRDQIRAHVVTMVLAGHETTANALAFALHLLAHSPDVADQVRSEVEAATDGTDRMPDASDADRLPLCRAVISEALRLYPPAWTVVRECIADHELDGHVIRAGELAMLPQWVVHRDPRWWKSPEEFCPGRWLDPGLIRAAEGCDITHSPAALRPRWAYFPFGAGLRRCIGEGFAWTEATLALAVLVGRWRFRPVPERPLHLQPLLTLRPRDGVWLTPMR